VDTEVTDTAITMMRASFLIVGGMAAWLASSQNGFALPGQPAGSGQSSLPQQKKIVQQYCVGCHNEKMKSGGLAIDPATLDSVGDHAVVWEKVVRKLRAGLMPPAGLPRPDKASYDGLATWLETGLDQAAAANPNPGRTEALHRLNRAEYQNVVRDLLGLQINAADLLPADDGSYGFDNIAGVLKVSQTLMERYLSVARTVSRLAVGDPPLSPEAVTFRLPPGLPQYDHMDGLPFGTRGGTLINYTFPADGEYEIQVQLQRASGGAISGVFEQHEMEVSLDGDQLKLFTIKPDAKKDKAAGEEDAGGAAPVAKDAAGAKKDAAPKKELDADLHLRIPVKAGPRQVEVAFLMKDHAELTDLRKQFTRLDNSGGNGVALTQPHVAAVIITGPYGRPAKQAMENTPSRHKIFVCYPENAAEAPGCAKKILTTLARRAYRRPVTDADVAVLLAAYKEGNGNFEAGIERAVRRLLVSPEFLFRVEYDPADCPPQKNYRVTDVELASRLSFFLWSSMPDDELLNLAVAGKLKDPAVLQKQVKRMMADSRSSALVDNFAGQWLYLRNLPAVTPNLDMFPNYDEELRQSMRRETELFVSDVVQQNKSVLTLLDADYTFLNERLAKHYRIPNVYGSQFRKVSLGDQAAIRGGLLGQASILTVTSHDNRTSPVVRGKWVLENILGTPPPPPPANVPALKEGASADGKVLTMRERMAEHRKNPVCASCHAMIEPAGFALEHFDAVGQWRDVDDTRPVPWVRGEGFPAIDASGKLPDGTTFDGPAGLKQALMARPDRFVKTVTEKLMIYALGRGVEYYDMPSIRKIALDAQNNDYRFSTLVMGVVNSQPFQMRRTE
jgi:mono/diheme cytochrome c family protein